MDGAFSRIDKFIDANMDNITNIISSYFASDLNVLLSSSLALYIVFYGYMVLAGKVQAPIEDLIWNLARFALLITFMNNGDGWLDLTKEAIKGLSSIGTGSTGLGFIDDQFKEVGKIATKVGEDAPYIIDGILQLIIWAGFLLSAVPSVLLILANKISMYILLAFLPLFIFCLMWGWLKESFNQYMSALLSNALVIIVITTLLKSVVTFFTSFETKSGANVYLVTVAYFVTGFFGAFIIKYLAGICSNLMRVSIEKIPTTKSFQKASYDSSSGIPETKKGKALRYAKNTAGTLYNRLKL